MIFIDYPPGGLGNFLAQCLTNSINVSYDQLSFHREKNNCYDRLSLDNASQFINAFATYKFTKNVAIIHSFGNLNLVRQRYPDAKIIQVVVKDEIACFLNNLYRKAAADNNKSEQIMKNHLIKTFGRDSNATRRENYALSYLYWLTTPSYHNTSSQYSDIIINFDNLYKDKENFIEEIKKITNNNIEEIYKTFTRTQEVVLDKVKIYYDIVNKHKEYNQQNNFDVIDDGLLCGMLQVKYGREFFLPNQEKFECII